MNRISTAFLLLACTLFVVACSNKKGGDLSGTSDTAEYSYKDFRQRDTACGNNPDSACTVVKVAHPEFKGMPALNDTVARKMIGLFAVNGKLSDTSYDQLANDFIGVYHHFKQGQPKSTLYFLVDAKAKVLQQDSALLTLKVSGYTYHGGPHGMEYAAYINWNTKANKYVALSDILIKNYKDSLNKIGEQEFRKNEKLTDTAALNNGRTYFFRGGKFALPDNYLLSPKGILFLYNVYTIKAYAAGKTELLIPYQKIKQLLLPNSVISRYVK